jgi:hypothetical protein
VFHRPSLLPLKCSFALMHDFSNRQCPNLSNARHWCSIQRMGDPSKAPKRQETGGYDVIVAGAGPVGLTLAIDLGRRGVRCLLLERNRTTAPFPKMDRSNARTMEFYRRIGIVDRVRALGYPPEIPMDVFIVTRLCDPPLAVLRYRRWPNVASR